MRWRFVCSSALFVVAACGAESHPTTPERVHTSSIEVSDYEVNGDWVDRFATCPPPGDLGQEWYPPVPEWSPTGSADDAGAPPPIASTEQLGRTPTERAIEDTRTAFRSCYHRGLVHDPTQFGHVAIVLRVGPNGRVQKTESYGACELQHDVVACMRDVGKALRFDPPVGGKDTIIIPVVFQPRGGADSLSSHNDAYTAAAYVALEGMKAELHECETRARHEGKDVEAWGVFDMTIDAHGSVTSANVDPYHGDQELLGCAAEVMQRMKLLPPEGGKGKLQARITFNARAGTR
jgi:hypothetical protein